MDVEPPKPSLTDEINVLQLSKYLAFDEIRAAVLRPFQVHRLEVLIESRLDAGFEFADGGLEEP